MPGGGPPKPVEAHKLEGTYRPDRHPERVSIAGTQIPDEIRVPPQTCRARRRSFWRAVAPRLAEAGVLDRVDVFWLRLLATMWCRIMQAGAVVKAQGLHATGSTGQIKEHPALKIERESIALFDRLAQGYGITPTARVRLGLAALQAQQMADEVLDTFGDPELRPIDGSASDVA